MGQLSSPLLLLTAIVTCRLVVATVRIQITPHKYNGVILDAFNVTCTTGDITGCGKKVLALQVSRNGDRPLVTLQQNSQISEDLLLASNIETEGYIDEDAHQSNLTVTFTNAMKEDSGSYTCTVLYLDQWGYLQQEADTKNFTVDGNDLHDVVRHLMGQLTSMRTELEHMSSMLTQQQNETQLAIQNVVVEQRIELEAMENKINQSIGNDNYVSAFMAGYTGSGSLSSGNVMKFKGIQMNVGGDYNKDTSTYTAPRDGVYAFHLFVKVESTYKYFYVDILVNQVSSARVNAKDKDHYDQSSVTSVVNLKKGDTVKCQIQSAESGVTVTSFPLTAFSGYLIQTL